MDFPTKCGRSLEKLGARDIRYIQLEDLADAGNRFLGITADEEYGGLAMGYQAHCIVMEEISKASGMKTCLRSWSRRFVNRRD